MCDLLFAMRYAPRPNFTAQPNNAFISMGAFGAGVMFIEGEGDELRHRSVHISEVCIAENAHGLADTDTVFRKAMLMARQAVERFGADRLMEQIVADADDKPDTLYEFGDVVLPNHAPDRMAWNYRGMGFSSFYLCTRSREIVSEGGFRTFPYAVSTLPGDRHFSTQIKDSFQVYSPSQLHLPLNNPSRQPCRNAALHPNQAAPRRV